MVFSSLLFTFYFLPLTVLIYNLSKDRYKNAILVVASLLFYAYGEPEYVFLMIGSIFFNYLLALLIDNRLEKDYVKSARLALALDVCLNIGLLCVFKYLTYSLALVKTFSGAQFTIPGIRLPIGISFFTFQAMSYCIDVYARRVRAQKNPMYTALYISFFPQLIAGPIVRYNTIEEQILHRSVTSDDMAEGIRRFFLGFAKKVILANTLADIAEEAFALESGINNPIFLWLGSIAFTLQIFYDFSGYSDMAIGLGRMFGFKFAENFNYPYISRSVTEFWRRWHISLGTWFRDYVYFPLGGSRVKKPRLMLNLFIVWVLTGIWHGANVTFVIWGLFYFILLVIEKWILKPDNRNPVIKVIWQMITLFAVNFAWVIFNSISISTAINYIKGMIGLNGASPAIDAAVLEVIYEYSPFLLAGLVFATPVIPYIERKLDEIEKKGLRIVARLAQASVYCFMFTWAVSSLILGHHNPFIYFNF